MKHKNYLLLLMLAFCQFVFAQRPVTNLHYTYTEKSAKKPEGVLKYEFNFNWNQATQMFVADKVNEKGKVYPRHIIDYTKKIIVVEMEKRNEYVLEENDSFWASKKVKLEPVDETKEIKGYKCHGYKFSAEIKLYMNGPLANAAMQEEYTLWVTDELQFNNESNHAIVALLRNQSVQGADFKGVLVQMDYKLNAAGRVYETVIALDADKLDQKPETIKWPWESSDGVAWIEQPQVTGGTTLLLHPGWKTDGNNGGVYRKGDGSVQAMNTRLKDLLVRITGQEKPKTKIQYFQNIFGVGPWGN
jgi:hypothetical protein